MKLFFKLVFLLAVTASCNLMATDKNLGMEVINCSEQNIILEFWIGLSFGLKNQSNTSSVTLEPGERTVFYSDAKHSVKRACSVGRLTYCVKMKTLDTNEYKIVGFISAIINFEDAKGSGYNIRSNYHYNKTDYSYSYRTGNPDCGALKYTCREYPYVIEMAGGREWKINGIECDGAAIFLIKSTPVYTNK